MRKPALMLAAVLFLCACTGQIPDGDGMVNSYTMIDQETAKQMMEADDGHVIVDVRRQDEYDEGHIPGAILIPNESIGTTPPAELPDLHQIILIYCRSGNRSKQAAQKLFDMGYTHVFEFGGINTWDGEIVTEEKPLRIRVTGGTHTVVYRLNGSGPAKSLYDMLPLETEIENYGGNEKIFYPEETISSSGGIEGGGEAGALALFSPWGNVVLYYGSFDAYPGLYLLGEAEDGADVVGELSGTIRLEALN